MLLLVQVSAHTPLPPPPLQARQGAGGVPELREDRDELDERSSANPRIRPLLPQ